MEPCIVTTSWDDGSKLDLRLAELLEKHGVKGTFYVPRSYLDEPLQGSDIVALDEEFEIGAHTLHHVALTTIPPEEAKREIDSSKVYLEELLVFQLMLTETKLLEWHCRQENSI